MDIDGSVAELRDAFGALADPERAEQQAAYMKDHFPFLGLGTPERRKAQKPVLDSLKAADGDDLLAFAHACYAEPGREFHYAAADALRRHVKVLEAHHLAGIEDLISTNAWWDTVDSLAVHTVGPLVKRHPELSPVMDEWVGDDDLWIARTAILHQLMWKDDTDAERLFGYVDARAADTEFFIRKACGWALRQYARTDPDAVRAFVDAREDTLSGLTKREARKHLDR